MSVQYVVNDKGQKTGVFISLDEYKDLLERLEDTEALAMLEKMRKEPLETRSFDDFLGEYSQNV